MRDIVRRTPAETLTAALAETETESVLECLVLMTTEDGNILTMGSTSVVSTRLGLLEMAKALIISDLVKDTTV